jgi:hypothetical protein
VVRLSSLLWWELTFTCPFVIAAIPFFGCDFQAPWALTIFLPFLLQDLSIRLARDSLDALHITWT